MMRMHALNADGTTKRVRGGSISGRLRACSDLEESGVINKMDKSFLKDLIISNDQSLRGAMDRYEMGDSSQLEALLRRTRVDTLGSVDIADGLDLDFLAAITSEDEEFGDDGPINMGYLDTGPANVGYLDTYTDPFAVSGHGEHHDKPRTRKLSFDTLFGFGNSQFEERSHQRADSISSIGLRYGFGKQGGKPGGYRKPSSGTDSEADMPLLFGDESPYVAHAKLLQTRGKEELKDKEKDKEKERRRIDVLKVQRTKNARGLPLAFSRPPEHSSPKGLRILSKGLERKSSEPLKPSLALTLETQAAGKDDRLGGGQLLQIPKFSMSDGPSLSKFIGAYSKESRRERIAKFIEKRDRRVWTKKVKYDVRKNFADSRVRVKGRFVKKEAEDVLRQMLTADGELITVK